MKKIILFFILALFSALANITSAQGVVINEILTSNTNVNTDEDGTYQDWVEIYNNGSTTVNLNGYGLSDDITIPFKWVFPAVTMASHSYLLIWCSDKDRAIAGQPLHTNFKISSTGEIITLTSVASVEVDNVPATAIPQNMSYGRSPNGTGPFLFFPASTPNAANTTASYSEILPPPTFSQISGYYTAGFSLSLATTVPGASIIYTLDGSEPDAANFAGTTYDYKNVYAEHPGQSSGGILHKTFQSAQYAAPISIVDRSSQPNKISAISSTDSHDPAYLPSDPIFKATVVRAKVIKAGALASTTASQTYIVTPSGNTRFHIPVLSLSLSENKLFDYNQGIYVAGKDFDDWRTANPTVEPEYLEVGNYYRRGIENEREANMTYIVNGNPVLNQNIGIRVHGATTRAFESKSLNLYGRSDYGTDGLGYKFFNDLADTNFETLTLSNSGGDFLNTMFRDPLNAEIVKALHCDTESYQPTITLVNGEYWGILNLREKYDNDYFKRVFNIPTGQLDFLENQDEIQEGDTADYETLVAYMNNNTLTSDANYNYITTRLDPENFADYYIANIFMDNADWPGTNVSFWRKKTAAYDPAAPYGQDGRWRWIFHDMDDTFSFGSDDFNDNSLAKATATNGPDYPNPAWSTLFLRRMLGNANFKNYFINRFADLMNTSFLPTRMVSTINEMKAVIYNEIPEHIARWKSPSSMDDYDYYIQYETDFSNARPAFQRNHIRSKFGIASNINAALDVSDAVAGFIHINTIDIKNGTPGITGNPYPWTGIYFSNIPVTVKAVANPGYVFSYWSGASSATTAEITLTPAASFNLVAHFTVSTTALPQPIYYWMMNSTLANNTPLETMSTTFMAGATEGVINYQSCLAGYPFTSSDPNWRKASMERRNSPTAINYIPEANGGLDFATSDMKGLQIKEPLENGGLGNTMVFNFSTVGYNEIKFSFAAINELTNATSILIDYAVNPGTPIWITTGLAATTLPLNAAYTLYSTDFTSIASANNNPDFKVRLRFAGNNMTADTGNRITFNNIAVMGTSTLAVAENNTAKFEAYPNPFSDIIVVSGAKNCNYKVFTIDGKMIKSGIVESSQINLEALSTGIYLLQLSSDDSTEIKKIVKK